MEGRRKRILAVASAGGHWVQLQRVMPAFEGHEVVYVTTDPVYREQFRENRVHVVNDANQWDRIGSLRLGLRVAWIVLRERPHVAFSTGAAPGCFAIIFARLVRAKTIWLDSIANIDQMSLSGRLVRRFATLWLTQWPHLSGDGGPEYAGRVF